MGPDPAQHQQRHPHSIHGRGLGFVYLYEQYRVDDYALGDETIRQIDLPGGLLVYYRYRPYDAHSFWGRVTYVF